MNKFWIFIIGLFTGALVMFAVMVFFGIQDHALVKPEIKPAQEYKTTNEKGMNKVFEFIKQCKTYYLATADGSQPRVRPFGTINIFEDKLYIQTGKKKRTAKQLAENPLAELCCFDGERWIRVCGTLIPDERVEAKKSMLDAYPELRGMYDENDSNTIVYYFKDATAWLSSFTDKEEEIKF